MHASKIVFKSNALLCESRKVGPFLFVPDITAMRGLLIQNLIIYNLWCQKLKPGHRSELRSSAVKNYIIPFLCDTQVKLEHTFSTSNTNHPTGMKCTITLLEWNVHACFNTGSPLCGLKLRETTASTKIYQSKWGGHGLHSHFYSIKKYTYLVPLFPFCEHLQIYPNKMCTILLYINENEKNIL
jgi:hypothetical protein